MQQTEAGEARAEELMRRIRTLEAQDEASFGRFTRWDWIVCVVLGFVLPVAVTFWFAW